MSNRSAGRFNQPSTHSRDDDRPGLGEFLAASRGPDIEKVISFEPTADPTLGSLYIDLGPLEVSTPFIVVGREEEPSRALLDHPGFLLDAEGTAGASHIEPAEGAILSQREEESAFRARERLNKRARPGHDVELKAVTRGAGGHWGVFIQHGEFGRLFLVLHGT